MSYQVAPSPQLVNARDAASMLGLSLRTVWRLLQAGQFPEPIRIGCRAVRWRVEDIAEYVRQLPPAGHSAVAKPIVKTPRIDGMALAHEPVGV